jgi:hypothetical protein
VGVEHVVCPNADMPLPWTKVILQQEHELLLSAQAFLRERWADRYEIIFSNRRLLELAAKGSTKGGAVLWVADRLGWARAHLLRGDNQNDLPMLACRPFPLPLPTVPPRSAIGAPLWSAPATSNVWLRSSIFWMRDIPAEKKKKALRPLQKRPEGLFGYWFFRPPNSSSRSPLFRSAVQLIDHADANNRS